MGFLTSSIGAFADGYKLYNQRRNLYAARDAYKQSYDEWQKNVGSKQGLSMAGSKKALYDAKMLKFNNDINTNTVQQLRNMSRWLI